MLIKDRRLATAYAIQAMALVDQDPFRDRSPQASEAGKPLMLRKPPGRPGEITGFAEDETGPSKINDRKLFA
jgi:hypothetical protein